MKIVVGVTPDSQGQDAVALGLTIAATTAAEIIFANIYPVNYGYASPGHIDAEWHAYLVEEANRTVGDIRASLGERAGVSYRVHGHKSSGIGLIEVAVDEGAEIIVIGSAAGGSQGRLTSGSTADQLFHGSPFAVILAPAGMRSWAPPQIGRIVVAYQASPETEYALDLATAKLLDSGTAGVVSLHLITLVERVSRSYARSLGRSAENSLLDSARAAAAAAQQQAVERLAARGIEASASLIEGESMTQAISRFDWRDDDLLVVGSADSGPLRRVFLGNTTHKIIRSATVPVAVTPRS